MGCIVPILALAAAAAGTGLQMAGTQKAKTAMNNRTMEELLRQQGIQGKAAKEFAQSLQGSGEEVTQQQLQEGETEKAGLYDQLQSVPLAAGSQPLVGGSSPVQNLRDSAQMSLSNQGRARLGRYDKWMLDQAVKNLHSGQMQSIYGQEAQRSQNVLPLELQDASHAGDNLTGIGQGLGILGSLLSMGSMSGLGGASTAASSAATAVPTAGSNVGYGMLNAAALGSGLYGMNRPVPISGYGYSR